MQVKILRNPYYKGKANPMAHKRLPSKLKGWIADRKRYAKSHGCSYKAALKAGGRKMNKGTRAGGLKTAIKLKKSFYSVIGRRGAAKRWGKKNPRKGKGHKKGKKAGRNTKGRFVKGNPHVFRRNTGIQSFVPKTVVEGVCALGGFVGAGTLNLGVGVLYNKLTKAHVGKTWHGYVRAAAQTPIPAAAGIVAWKAKSKRTKLTAGFSCLGSGIITGISLYNAIRQHIRNSKAGGPTPVSGTAAWIQRYNGAADYYVVDGGKVQAMEGITDTILAEGKAAMGFGNVLYAADMPK